MCSITKAITTRVREQLTKKNYFMQKSDGINNFTLTYKHDEQRNCCLQNKTGYEYFEPMLKASIKQ